MRTHRSARYHSSSRHGVVAVETAVVLLVFLFILFALLDLGFAVLNLNNLKDAAQQVSRTAIVRGTDAAPQFNVWGPSTYSGNAATGDEIASQAAAAILIMPLAKVNIVVEWLDGGSDDGDRVRATLTYAHPLIAPSFFGFSSIPLTAVSTIRIAN